MATPNSGPKSERKFSLLRTLRFGCVLLILLSLFAVTLPTRAQPMLDPVKTPHVFAPRASGLTDYPTDPPYDIPWAATYNTLADVVDAFNNARGKENALLGTFVKPMVAPSAETWAQMSDGEKALWLVNDERSARGLAPLQGLETNVNEVAQAYAEWLLANNKFGHEEDGRTPWQRLEGKAAIAACHDFLQIAENLYFQGTTSSDGVPLVVEQAVYSFLYTDAGSQWGHRHAILWTPYSENNGAGDREGYMGVGHARGGYTSPFDGIFYHNTDIIVMNFFDPCATWVETPPVDPPPPPEPEPVETPIPPPQTRTVSGKTTIPVEEVIVAQGFERDTWPGAWNAVDGNGGEDGEYRWTPANCFVYEGEFSGMAIGGGADGLPLGCEDAYPNNARSWLTYGPFSLENAISAILQAKVWIDTETGYDMLCMMVSTDNIQYDGTCFSGNSQGWIDEQLDLSSVHRVGNLLGRANLYVGFVFLSDESVSYANGGAYVDNILLSKQVIAAGAALYGVAISSEDGHTTLTDQSGNFSLAGLSPGIHTLTPDKEGYEFYPPSITVDLTAGDVANISFVGAPYSILNRSTHFVHLPLIRPR